VRIRLKCGDESISPKCGYTSPDEQHAAVLAQSLPDEPSAADLCDRGEQEQGSGPHGSHEGIVIADAIRKHQPADTNDRDCYRLSS